MSGKVAQVNKPSGNTRLCTLKVRHWMRTNGSIEFQGSANVSSNPDLTGDINAANAKFLSLSSASVVRAQHVLTVEDVPVAVQPIAGYVAASVAVTNPPVKGAVSAPVAGVVTYTPTGGETGLDAYTYTITDASGKTRTVYQTIGIVGALVVIPPINNNALLDLDAGLTLNLLPIIGAEVDIVTEGSNPIDPTSGLIVDATLYGPLGLVVDILLDLVGDIDLSFTPAGDLEVALSPAYQLLLATGLYRIEVNYTFEDNAANSGPPGLLTITV